MNAGTREILRRIAAFGAIGVVNTLIYAVIAWVLVERAGMAASFAGAIGYVAGGVHSYIANRTLTFRSREPHRAAIARFVAANLAAFSLSVIIPWLCTDLLKNPVWVSIGLVTVLVPAFSFLLLNRFVFAERAARQGRNAS